MKNRISNRLAATLVLAGLLWGGNVSAACGNFAAGEVCKVTFERKGGLNTAAWSYLQKLQIHLKELDSKQKLMVVGCETDRNDQASCADLESGIVGGKIKARKVNRLSYWVLPADWDADMEALFTTAWGRLTSDDPGSPNRLDFKIRNAPAPEESACTDPAEWVQPCYSRTICQQYQGCSKSKFSCQACTPVP